MRKPRHPATKKRRNPPMEEGTRNIGSEGDSNTLIMPAKRGKGKNQVREATNQSKLSKSQKRKLKKIEEDEERERLLSESIEALEKNRIPEDVFCLLRSSVNIGRDETSKEKRRMAVNFSKARLEVPSSIRSFEMASCPVEAITSDIDEEGNIETEESISSVPVETRINSMSGPLAERSYDGSFCSPVQEDDRASLPGDCIAAKSDFKDQDRLGRIVPADCVDSGDLQGSSSRVHARPLVVPVFRPMELEKERRDLPIVGVEQEIMEAVNAEEHEALIICGQTGCGKTTQVPQFLFEAGFGSSQCPSRRGVIGVTQPRRVAVLTTAKRVAFELGLNLGKEVGFQVRYDKRIGDSCSIKFMTDGILLREVQSDILLRRYSVIILDEAHERSVNTDILVGMLSRVVRLRQKKFEEQRGQNISPDNMIFPLKLILMSATLRVEDFVSGSRLFHKPPPVINVEGRQFDVVKHYSRRTETVDFIGQAYKKVLSIHKKLPHGGILVFVTGQREVELLCKKLRKVSKEMLRKSMKRIGIEKAPATSDMTSTDGINPEEKNDAFDMHVTPDEENNGFPSCYADDMPDSGRDESEISYDSKSESNEDIVVDDGDNGHLLQRKAPKENGDFDGLLGKEGALSSLKAAFETLAGKVPLHSNSERKRVPLPSEDLSLNCITENNSGRDELPTVGVLHVLPLYAMLPAKEQLRVYEDVKEGERLVVITTNVAETSLTIPGIKYVVDTGREKVKKYNTSTGMEAYEIQWISKASADQRAGRAGRTGPGHCYRLYSRAVYGNIFPQFSCPEILKVPVDSIVLVLKSMGIDKVENFPFPTPPEPTALSEAVRCLKTLEALDSNGRLTPMGKAMANYPMSPRHSRMLLTAIQILQNRNFNARSNLVLGFAIAAAAALSHPSPFQMLDDRPQSGPDGLEEDGEYGHVDEEVLSKEEKLRKKKLKERIKVSRATFSNPSSDALTTAYALQCFELCENPKKFCDENALHLKIMEEMSKLRKQILLLVFQQNTRQIVDHAFSWTHGTIDDVEQAWRVSSSKCALMLEEEKIVRIAICAGWADRVSRKLEKQKKSNAIEYQACMVNEPVFLHRLSSLFSSAPEFLVYSELLHTKRPYLHGATSVQPEWLVQYVGSLCCFSTKDDQKLEYSQSADRVFSVVIPTFGPHMWLLGRQQVQVTDFSERVKGFAFALLEGRVLQCLKSVRDFLSAPPSMILDKDASGQRRVGNLLMKLNEKMIDSRAKLRAAWKDNPKELYAEIADWFTKSFHENFGTLWTEMLVEVELEPSKPGKHDAKRVKRDSRRK